MGRSSLVITVALIAACGGSDADGDGLVDGPDADGGDVLGPSDGTGDPVPEPGTWHGEIAPIVAEHCGSCHVAEGVAPFALNTYEDAKRWAPAMQAAILDGTMPPFDARETETCEPELPWKDDLRLTEDEIRTISAWVDAGAPEGDPEVALAVDPPVPDRILEPDAVFSIPEPYTVDGDRDRYMCFRIPVDVDEEVYLDAVEVLPDNDLVVHHVLVWSDPLDQSAGRAGEDGAWRCNGTPGFFPTDLIGTWVPGAGPMRVPEGTGVPVKPGASIVVNVHYHPTGTGPEVDQTEIALSWNEDKPANYVTWFLVDLPFLGEVQPGPNDRDDRPEFRIPAGVADHRERVVLDTAPYADFMFFDLKIFAVTPHMHYLGREMQVNILRGDEDDDACLVHTPEYRFDWQTTYVYDGDIDDLPSLRPGDAVEVNCTYDNSWSNPFLADQLDASRHEEPYDVTWGEETGDEMCMAMLGLVIPPIDIAELAGGLF